MEWAGLLESGRGFAPRYAQPGKVGRLLRIARAIDAGEIGRVRRLVLELHLDLEEAILPQQGDPDGVSRLLLFAPREQGGPIDAIAIERDDLVVRVQPAVHRRGTFEHARDRGSAL